MERPSPRPFALSRSGYKRYAPPRAPDTGGWRRGAIRLGNFRVVSDGAQNFRYRALISFHSGKQTPEFRGRLEFLVTFVQRGKSQEMVIPSRREPAREFQVEVRNFLRKEGGFELPPGARLQSVEARVLQGDTLKVRRVAQL
jgi:hypothetical protein